jgi:ribosomal peptide maturation radical SAM protein 1
MPDSSPSIALVSAPWPLFDRPSVQIGALKAYLAASLPEIRVEAQHAYLSVAAELGYGLYRPISERTWLAEIPYAALLYPGQRDALERLWRRQCRGLHSSRGVDLEAVVRRVETASDRFLASITREPHFLAGFSICLGQLTSTLYFIQRLRQRAPALRIVIGGSSCAGALGQSLLETFPEIDFAISGEGERPLVHLVRSLLEARDPVPAFPGLLTRAGGAPPAPNSSRTQVASLDSLPPPDYDDYFRLLASLGPEKAFLPRLPMEISRGCWWRTPRSGGRERGCRFCNLNLQWEGYRAKSHRRVVQELDALTRKHRVLSVSFTDNLLPAKNLQGLFQDLTELPKDLRLFAEMRATTPPEAIAAMASAGVCHLQVGIEALSTRLLRRLRKGTTTILNLEIMKRCEAPGMPELDANLILQFPGSGEEEVQETLHALEFAAAFRPLRAIPFWLGYGSPVWQDPHTHGIQKMFNHPYYARLFPKEILRSLVLMIQGFHGGARLQQRLWRPVRERVRAWQRTYAEIHCVPRSRPILSYRDGETFLVIYERRKGKDPTTHRLQGTSREIYLFCDRNRSFRSIAQRFERQEEDRLRAFLRMMQDKRLLFEENDRYLSLAVPANGYGETPGR